MLPSVTPVPIEDLCKYCEKALDTFNENGGISPDTHIEHFFQSHSISPEQADGIFIYEVFYGCLRFEKLLEITVQVYMEHVNREASIADTIKYQIVSYLLFFRIEELQFPLFKQCIKGFFPPTEYFYKICRLLRYLVDEQLLLNLLLPKWKLFYDEQWIKTEIQKVIPFTKVLLALCDQWEAKNQPIEKKEITTFEPFQLTQPKPPKIKHKPKLLNVKFKSLPVPESTFTPENAAILYKTALSIENRFKPMLAPEVIQKNRETQSKNYDKVEIPFQTINLRKETQPPRKSSPSKEEQSQEEFKKTVRRDVTPPIIRMNTAAILREDHLYKKKQLQEAEILEKFEVELRDGFQFEKYVEQERIKEEAEKKLLIEKRKVEMQLTDERARIARKNQEQQVKKQVKKEKIKTELELTKVKNDIEKKIANNKKKAEELSEQTKQAVEVAKKQKLDEKVKIAETVRNETKELEVKLAQQMELERQRKEELILQIKAAQIELAKNDVKFFDPTEKVSHGLLNEMSYAELVERLDNLKKRQEEQIEEKRREILEEKSKKKQEIIEKQQKIIELRTMAKKEKDKLKQKAKEDQELIAKELQKQREDKLLELHKKLQEERDKKRKEKEEQEEAEKQRVLQQQLLGAGKLQSEFKVFEDIEKGKERQIKEKAKEMLEKFKMERMVKSREAELRNSSKLNS